MPKKIFMNILLSQPLFFSEIGKRQNNEDFIFPLPNEATSSNHFFIVCDGVGGQNKGEVASQMACKCFEDFFLQNSKNSIDKVFIQQAFDYVENQFDDYFIKHPEAKGMATTVVLVYFFDNQAYVAHCGDSRCYQIRGGKAVFNTIDHTPANHLVRNGIITVEEAKASKRSSKISRAMQGKSVSKVQPEIKHIEDIQKNDMFFLCSDGVWDTFESEHDGEDNNRLVKILGSASNADERMQYMEEMIKETCQVDAKDNYSAYLIHIESVGIESNLVSDTTLLDKKPVQTQHNNTENKGQATEQVKEKTTIITPSSTTTKQLNRKNTATTVSSGDTSTDLLKWLLYAASITGIVMASVFVIYQFVGLYSKEDKEISKKPELKPQDTIKKEKTKVVIKQPVKKEKENQNQNNKVSKSEDDSDNRTLVEPVVKDENTTLLESLKEKYKTESISFDTDNQNILRITLDNNISLYNKTNKSEFADNFQQVDKFVKVGNSWIAKAKMERGWVYIQYKNEKLSYLYDKDKPFYSAENFNNGSAKVKQNEDDKHMDLNEKGKLTPIKK